MSRRPNVVLYFKTNNLCTRFEGISGSNVQSGIQSFNLFDRIETIMNLYRGRFSHCHYFFWKVFELFEVEEVPDGGLLPYKSDEGARRKISRTPLKGDRILFHGRVPNSFPPLRGTNSTTINYINGTTNYNSNEDNFKNTFSSRTFMKVLS